MCLLAPFDQPPHGTPAKLVVLLLVFLCTKPRKQPPSRRQKVVFSGWFPLHPPHSLRLHGSSPKALFNGTKSSISGSLWSFHVSLGVGFLCHHQPNKSVKNHQPEAKGWFSLVGFLLVSTKPKGHHLKNVLNRKGHVPRITPRPSQDCGPGASAALRGALLPGRRAAEYGARRGGGARQRAVPAGVAAQAGGWDGWGGGGWGRGGRSWATFLVEGW